MIKRVLAIGVIIALLAAFLFYKQHEKKPLKVSGFVEAHEIRVGSRVGGRITSVPAEEGQPVKPGDVLITLEPYDLGDLRAQAAAQVAARRADYERLKSGYRSEEIAQGKAHAADLKAQLDLMIKGPRQEDIAAAQAQLDLSKAQLELAQNDFKRSKSLFDRKIVSQEEFDRTSSQLKVAEQTAHARTEDLDKLKSGSRPEEIEESRARAEEANQALQLMVNGNRAEDIAAAKANLDAAEAALRAIDQQIQELTVRAPVEGTVEAVDLRPGDLISPNAPAISIMDTGELWVRAYLPEDMLGVKLGDKAELTVDSFHGERFAGHITFVAREAEFTPGNVQTPEDRSKQVFRIKVTIDEGRDRLRPGMVADVWLSPRQK